MQGARWRQAIARQSEPPPISAPGCRTKSPGFSARGCALIASPRQGRGSAQRNESLRDDVKSQNLTKCVRWPPPADHPQWLHRGGKGRFGGSAVAFSAAVEDPTGRARSRSCGRSKPRAFGGFNVGGSQAMGGPCRVNRMVVHQQRRKVEVSGHGRFCERETWTVRPPLENHRRSGRPAPRMLNRHG